MVIRHAAGVASEFGGAAAPIALAVAAVAAVAFAASVTIAAALVWTRIETAWFRRGHARSG